MLQTRYDRERGCGWRKQGGFYLVADGPSAHCDRMPLPLTVCTTCGHGLKPSRGWTWVQMPTMLLEVEPTDCGSPLCGMCPLCPVLDQERMGLLWAGEQFYKTPDDWIREAHEQGVSRRIAQIPKGLELGQTWVLMAHRKAVQGVNEKGEIVWTPGIIQAFRPQAVEYVVRGDETDEELASLEKRGITPVRIERVTQQQVLI